MVQIVFFLMKVVFEDWHQNEKNLKLASFGEDGWGVLFIHEFISQFLTLIIYNYLQNCLKD